MSLHDLDIKGKSFLAPMAGYTDTIFRKICKRFGADFMVSELVSSEGLVRNHTATMEMCKFDSGERPFGIQLFGANPQVMSDAAVMVEELFRPDFIDINMGCPAAKVVRKGAGAALMREPEKAGAVVEAVVKAVKSPVSAKIRTGWSKGRENAAEVAEILEDAGIMFITVHARARNMGYGQNPEPEWIAGVVERVSIPVVGNGGVSTPAGAVGMMRNTGCSAVMIGHGALGNPWIFSRIAAFRERGVDPGCPGYAERLTLYLEHFDEVLRIRGERAAVFELRKHFSWYTKGMPHGGVLREKVNRSSSPMEVIRLVKQAIRELTVEIVDGEE